MTHDAHKDRILVTPEPEVLELIPSYLEARRREVIKLGRLLDAGDCAAIAVIGHQLIGAGGYGFDGLTLLARRLEEAASHARWPALRACIEAIADYLERVEIVAG